MDGIFGASGPADSNGAQMQEDEFSWDLKDKFHNTVRENIIFLIFFLTLCIISWLIISVFLRKKEGDGSQLFSTPADDDESIVYRICFWICVFSLGISMGATLLLPISVISNEVLLLYPSTYYVQWLNGMLIQGLWNLIFLFANISLFILLPFAYLFIESEGFSGHKKGLIAKFQEAAVVLALVGFSVWGIAYILAAFLSPGRFAFGGLLSLNFVVQLPFIYSCISFLGVLLLLVCTPLGFAHLFTVLSQQMVGPQFFRNLDEEFETAHLELEALKNKYKDQQKQEKLAQEITASTNVRSQSSLQQRRSSNGVHNARYSPPKQSKSAEFIRQFNRVTKLQPEADDLRDLGELKVKISEKELELCSLETMRRTPGWKRNLMYPLAFVLVLALTALAVLMVILNTLQLVVGIKALEMSAETISLGLTSMSMLGVWGAGLEVILIFYFISTSLIGLYNLPGIRKIRPVVSDSPTSHIIYNCALVLILSSALPLLARILGISNFDLLGHYGKIEWLGNFYLVLLYNVIFSAAATMSLVTKFTAGIRQELLKRFRAFFDVRPIRSILNFWRRNMKVVSKVEMQAIIKED